ncbi:hypothetical protein B566_EDAN001080 [Ephemera danica]|nr:hypothetical protein B566_EDAN001080 [Ephemera danica]
MVSLFIFNTLHTGQNISKLPNLRVVRLWDTVIMGKAEGHGENWHGHVTALTVSPDFRRLGVANTLMAYLEEVSERKRAYFVDLFVRVSNQVAIKMYTALGYIVYRTVLEYYSGDPDENAYDMRKALSRDVEKASVVPLAHPVRPEDVD